MKRALYTGLPPERLDAIKGLVSCKAPRPPLPEAFRARLREALAPEAAQVEVLLGRAPAAWKS